MTGLWPLAFFAAGALCGCAVCWVWMRPAETEEEYDQEPVDEAGERQGWPLERIAPERYLVRFPEGDHAALAEQIVKHHHHDRR
jgi:hypothetical protein